MRWQEYLHMRVQLILLSLLLLLSSLQLLKLLGEKIDLPLQSSVVKLTLFFVIGILVLKMIFILLH